ncbi:MAG: hypothetical protein AAF583_14495 [Pseudomonadota bacterium]
MKPVLIFFATAIFLAACEDSVDEQVVWGDVDPAFIQALQQYENWGKSCEPGNPAREAGIEAGVTLLRVDAMTCAYNRLAASAEPLSPDERKTKGKLVANLYGMTGDRIWLTTEFCDVKRGERGRWLIELNQQWTFVGLQPTLDSIRVPKEFAERQHTLLECRGDWELPDFTAPNDPG